MQENNLLQENHGHISKSLNLCFNNIHLIDLDGALSEKPVNENIIKEINLFVMSLKENI